MISTGAQRIFDEITNRHIALLVEIIRDSDEMSSTCATYLLSLIPTRKAAEEILVLIEEANDIGTAHDLASAFVAHSPFRDEMRPALEKIFEQELGELEILYANTQEFDPRLLDMPDRAEEIAKALEYELAANKSVGYYGTKPINWPD